MDLNPQVDVNDKDHQAHKEDSIVDQSGRGFVSKTW
jgi:hypothetical protein